jgi:hypothetical protein
MAGNKSKIECPLCRVAHKLDRRGVEGLPKNRYVANIIDKLKTPPRTPSTVPVQYALYAPYASPSVSSTGLPPVYPVYSQEAQPIVNNPTTTTTTTSTANPATPFAAPSFAQNANVEISNYSPSAPPLEDLLDPAYGSKQKQPNVHLATEQRPAYPPLPSRDSLPPSSPSVAQNSINNNNKPNDSPSLIGSLLSFFLGPEAKEEAPVVPPEAALYAPFVTHPNQIRALFNDWVGKLWFAPMEFTQKVTLSSPQPLYVPFWIFSASSTSVYTASVSRYERNTDTKKRTELWSNVTGSRNCLHKDLSYCADVSVSRMVLDLLVEFDDWQKSRAAMNQPATVDAHSPKIDKHMEMKQAWGRISQKLTVEERDHCYAKCKKDEKAEAIEGFQLNVSFSDLHGQLIFLPVYLCTFYFESNEYFFLVNAQTGSIRGQRPYGLGKLGEVGKTIGNLFFGKKS